MTMNSPRIVLISFFLIATLCAGVLHAQWVQSNGPRGAFVNAFDSDGSRILVGTEHGILLSTDNGSTWLLKNAGLTNINVRDALVLDTTYFAATDDGIFRSTDRAESWALAGNGLVDENATSLTTDGIHVFAGSYDLTSFHGGVFTSTDQGMNWNLIGFQYQRVNLVQMVDTVLFVGTMGHMVGGGGLSASTDSGKTWFPTKLGGLDVYSITSINNSFFAGTSFGLFTVTNIDSFWTSAGLPVAIFSYAAIDTSIYAAGWRIYRSANAGGNWSIASSTLPNTYVNSLLARGSNLLAGTSGGGIFLTTDSGLTWAEANNDLRFTDVTALTLLPTGLFAGTWGGGIFLSNDDGLNWTSCNSGFPSDSRILALLAAGDTLYAGSYYGGVSRSTDNGNTWVTIGLSDKFILSLKSLGGRIIAGTEGEGVYVSSDGGTNWIQRNTGLGYYFPRCLAVVGDTLYAGTASFMGTGGNGVFRITNTDTTWTAAGLAGKRILSLAIRYPNMFAGTDGNGVYLSTDGGANWNPVNTYLGGSHVSSLTFVDSLVVAGTEVGVYRSANNGQTWKLIGTDLPQMPVNSMIAMGNKLFAGASYSAVWSIPLSEVTSVARLNDGIPVEFVLEQNYPNPFNSQTAIRFSLANRTFVNLSVFNVLGQEVARLLSRQFDAGTHTTTFDAAGLTSGLYLYRISAGSFTQTRKLLLVK